MDSSARRWNRTIKRGDLLLGRLRRAALDGDPDRSAEKAMESRPSTVHMDTALDKLAEHPTAVASRRPWYRPPTALCRDRAPRGATESESGASSF